MIDSFTVQVLGVRLKGTLMRHHMIHNYALLGKPVCACLLFIWNQIPGG
ncbi:MAG: hypothetical protein ACTSUE_08845 [Promethearchaeota archaeon]